MNISAQIQILKQKIADYQTKHHKRNWEQIEKLNRLWLELGFWQLIEKGEIKPPNYFLQVEKSWEHLKEIYQEKGKWPRKRLLEFLKRQKQGYGKWLVWMISQESDPKYLKFGKWLKKHQKSTH